MRRSTRGIMAFLLVAFGGGFVFAQNETDPQSASGAAVSLHDPHDRRAPATFLSMPEVALVTAQAWPIEMGAKALEMGAKALEIGAKAGAVETPDEGLPPVVAKRFLFTVPLPQGAAQVRLRATAYDSANLGSSPTEVLLQHSGVQPVPGHLYALCVGLSRYQNGSDPGEKGPISNLKFPFNVLSYAAPEEISALMQAVGQNEAAMQPVGPLEGRRLDEPVAQVR